VTAELPLTADVDREARRVQVEGVAGINGIDFVEVLSNDPSLPGHVRGAPRQRTLLVHLLNATPVPDAWTTDQVRITGGVRPDPRINPVQVAWVYPAAAVASGPLPDDVTPADRRLVDAALPSGAAARARVVAVRTTSSGDWSTYLLELLGTGGSGTPEHFDLPLCRIPFTFTVDCPSDLDCRIPDDTAAAGSPSAVLDYLARDAEALRVRLLDRLSTLIPGWTDRSPADPAVMLAELFAYLGDRLAYWQDAVAVEAYLGTARLRTSVRRHARLLNYDVHEGCSARAWLALRTDVPATVAAGAAVCDLPAAAGLEPVEATDAGAVVMETCADVTVHPRRNRLELHTWGDPEHVLPEGATSAFVRYPTAGGDPQLAAGDVMILADQPLGGVPEQGDPALRHAVRLDRPPVPRLDRLANGSTVLEIHWHAADALPRPLTASEREDGLPAVRAVALANVVLADHGATVPFEPVEPQEVIDPARYRPRLARAGLARVVPAPDPARSATEATAPDPRLAVPALVLDDGNRLWWPRPDLIGSSRLAAHVVVESDPDGTPRLRFGDGVTGRAPSGQTKVQARYRIGGGTRGNVGAGRLTTWLARAGGGAPDDTGADLRVWNPVGATGGADPEPLEQVRQLAPTAYRRQLRAVTDADHAATAETVPGVQRSVARRRWTGSWYAEAVTVDPLAGLDDAAVRQAVLDLLEVRRMAGLDVEVVAPVSAPLHLTLFVCVEPGVEPADVERRMLDALSSRTLTGGVQGFFHPDRWTFGQPLYLSDLVSAAMGVAGVAWVEVRRFARLGARRADTVAALRAGRITAQPREVLRCDSDPGNPEAGRVDLLLGGGS
jgi:hypothetical protein